MESLNIRHWQARLADLQLRFVLFLSRQQSWCVDCVNLHHLSMSSLLTVEQIKSLSSPSLLTVTFSKHCSGSALFKVFVGISVYCQWLCMCLYGTAGVVSEWDLWYDSVLLRRRAWPGLPAVDLSLPSRWVSHPCCLLTCQLVLGGRISWVSL